MESLDVIFAVVFIDTIFLKKIKILRILHVVLGLPMLYAQAKGRRLSCWRLVSRSRPCLVGQRTYLRTPRGIPCPLRPAGRVLLGEVPAIDRAYRPCRDAPAPSRSRPRLAIRGQTPSSMGESFFFSCPRSDTEFYGGIVFFCLVPGT
jgi:hypothetical protein